MITDTIVVTGQVKLVLTDAQGNVKQTEKANMVVTAGKAFMANALANSSITPFGWMALGTNSTAANVSDVALGTEIVRTAAGTSVVSTATTFTDTYGAGVGTGALTEAGLFNLSSLGGTMLAHVVFPVVNKGTLDSLALTWTITVN